MDYFINGVLNDRNTVIEETFLNRLTLFADIGRKAQGILMQYDPDGVNFLLKKKYKNVYHLYDWIQEATDFPQKQITRDDLPQLDGFQREWEKDGYTYAEGSRVLAKAFFQQRLLQKLIYLNEDGTVISEDRYDQRGFLSRKRMWDADGKKTAEFYYNPSGERRLIIHFGDNGKPMLYELVKYQSFFFNEKDLLAFCLQELLDDADILISERREYDGLLTEISAKTRLIRLYNSPFQGSAEGIEGILVRHETQLNGEKKYLLDEYGEEPEVAWKKFLENYKGSRGKKL